MRNHGNVLVSLSQLGRWLAKSAEGIGVAILPETAAEKLLVAEGQVVGVRTGDKGRGRAGEELGRFEPGSDLRAQVDDPGRGDAGASDVGARSSAFELARRRARRRGRSA